jgi:hypothetical protein
VGIIVSYWDLKPLAFQATISVPSRIWIAKRISSQPVPIATKGTTWDLPNRLAGANPVKTECLAYDVAIKKARPGNSLAVSYQKNLERPGGLLPKML